MATGEIPHDETVDRLGEYLRGTLPEAEQRRYAAHLETCQVCRDDVAALQAAANQVSHSLVRERVPAYLAGEMHLSEWTPFVAHLETCPVCWPEIVESGMALPTSMLFGAESREANDG